MAWWVKERIERQTNGFKFWLHHFSAVVILNKSHNLSEPYFTCQKAWISSALWDVVKIKQEKICERGYNSVHYSINITHGQV